MLSPRNALLPWVSRDNGSEAKGLVAALFGIRSENIVAHESSRLAPKVEFIIELSTCDCISEIEADEIFMWFALMVTYRG